MHTHHLSLDCRSQHQRVLELSHLLPMQLELALRVDVEQQQQQQQQQQQHRDRVQEVDSRGPAQRNGSQRSHLLSARQRGRGHRRDERPPSRMIAESAANAQQRRANCGDCGWSNTLRQAHCCIANSGTLAFGVDLTARGARAFTRHDVGISYRARARHSRCSESAGWSSRQICDISAAVHRSPGIWRRKPRAAATRCTPCLGKSEYKPLEKFCPGRPFEPSFSPSSWPAPLQHDPVSPARRLTCGPVA